MRSRLHEWNCRHRFACPSLSLHMHHGLRTDGRKRRLCTVARANFDEREIRIASRRSLEGQGAYVALAGDTFSARRTRARDRHQAVAFVAMHNGDRLTVTAQEVSSVHIHELEHRRVELQLQRHRVDILTAAERYRHLEGAAYALVAGR